MTGYTVEKKSQTEHIPGAKAGDTKQTKRPVHVRDSVQCRFAGENNRAPHSSAASESVQRRNVEANTSPSVNPAPTAINHTGLPDRLKTGLESLSGFDLSPVRVHYNSSKPKQVGALAYAQGANIHLGPGQEKHLPHEGWHVVQQMAGRVRPTAQYKGLAINASSTLEKEADVMGERARRYPATAHVIADADSRRQITAGGIAEPVIQGAWIKSQENEGRQYWDDTSMGIQWWFCENSAEMYFEIIDEDVLTSFPELKELAGEEHARPYKAWLQAWCKNDWINEGQLMVRLAIEEQLTESLTRSEIMKSGEVDRHQVGSDYSAEDKMALASYLDSLSVHEAMQYLSTEFSDYEIPKHLKQLGKKAGFSIRKAIARQISPARLKGMGRISQLIAKGVESLQQVLCVGASKDFAFPYVFTGGRAACYHMVAGEIGNAEALRKTIMMYSPDVIPEITVEQQNDYIKIFSVVAGIQKFQVISYEMSYGDFFELQNDSELGIPKKFDLIMDQMSWLDGSSDMANYINSLAKGGILISDGKLSNESDEFMAGLLGLEKIFQGRDFESEEEYGYRPANVYFKSGYLNEGWNRAVSRFYGVCSIALKDFSPDRFDKLSQDSVSLVRPEFERLLQAAEEYGADSFVEPLQKIIQILPQLEIESSYDSEDEAPPVLPDTVLDKPWNVITGLFICNPAMAARMQYEVGNELEYRQASGVKYRITNVDKEGKKYSLAKI